MIVPTAGGGRRGRLSVKGEKDPRIVRRVPAAEHDSRIIRSRPDFADPHIDAVMDGPPLGGPPPGDLWSRV